MRRYSTYIIVIIFWGMLCLHIYASKPNCKCIGERWYHLLYKRKEYEYRKSFFEKQILDWEQKNLQRIDFQYNHVTSIGHRDFFQQKITKIDKKLTTINTMLKMLTPRERMLICAYRQTKETEREIEMALIRIDYYQKYTLPNQKVLLQYAYEDRTKYEKELDALKNKIDLLIQKESTVASARNFS